MPAGGEIASPSPDALSPAAIARAHARLLQDHSLQFDFKATTPPKPSELPHWLTELLKAIGHGLGAVFKVAGPVMNVVFWAGVALAVALVLFLIAREFLGVRFGWRKRKPPPRPKPADWRPEAWKARALLEDADRLAAEGAYDEAVHLILYRSIDDIEGRRPRLVRPALTSRDIAALDAVPGAAREAFTRIAEVVEASFFGGRKAGQEDFAACRQAYEAFAFPEVWA